jgi:Na+/proline symporter
MNWLDFVVLFGTILGIAAYGVWHTRGKQNLQTYLKGKRKTGWAVIGLSVMATQASAITFLSTPGQGFNDGMRFVQNYFGMPLALIVVSMVFLPRYRKLNVYTAYEYLGQRFDGKTRILGALLFLTQRGLAAGITIYAPAIIFSTVLGWRLDLTILLTGFVTIIYTAIGGSEAVNATQKYQMAVIFAGMVAAFVILVMKLPANVGFGDALSVAGGFHRLDGVSFSMNPNTRYTFWSGLLGGFFLSLSYFGTDQSQVQRYMSGSSLRESRLGLLFNAVLKIPMQAFILLIGVLLFVFYQFASPPLQFNQVAWDQLLSADKTGKWVRVEQEFRVAQTEKTRQIETWIDARHRGDATAADQARQAAVAADVQTQTLRAQAQEAVKRNDNDFVFISFVLKHLPHGVIGLLMAVFFAAAFSSLSAELNALGSTTCVDLYRHAIKPNQSDAHYVVASKICTLGWGLVAVCFALSLNIGENLIQAVNIVGSIFYGVVLGLFLTAFFIKRVRGTAVFCGAILAQTMVFVLYSLTNIGYLWFNLIGCAGCVVLSLLFQLLFPTTDSASHGFEVGVASRAGESGE